MTPSPNGPQSVFSIDVMIWLHMIVIGSRIRDLSREFCNSLKEIGARYDPDKLISANDRQTLDVVLFHELSQRLPASRLP